MYTYSANIDQQELGVISLVGHQHGDSGFLTLEMECQAHTVSLDAASVNISP